MPSDMEKAIIDFEIAKAGIGSNGDIADVRLVQQVRDNCYLSDTNEDTPTWRQISALVSLIDALALQAHGER